MGANANDREGSWEKALPQLKVSSDLSPKFRSLATALDDAERLRWQLAGLPLKKRKAKRKHLLNWAAMYYFAHVYTQGAGIWHLAMAGFGTPGLILARSMLEAVIDLSYLWLCKQINGRESNEREAWIHYPTYRRDTAARKYREFLEHREAKELPMPEDISMWKAAAQPTPYTMADFKKRYGRDDWALKPKVDARARAVDDDGSLVAKTHFLLEPAYISVYKWTSSFVHGSSAAADGYMEVDGETITVQFGPSWRHVDKAVDMAAHYLSTITVLARHLFALPDAD